MTVAVLPLRACLLSVGERSVDCGRMWKAMELCGGAYENCSGQMVCWDGTPQTGLSVLCSEVNKKKKWRG